MFENIEPSIPLMWKGPNFAPAWSAANGADKRTAAPLGCRRRASRRGRTDRSANPNRL